MALGAKQLLALDWNRRELRLVLVRPRSDGVDLLKATCVPIPDGVQTDDPAAFGGFIRQALKDARIGVSRAVLAVPRDQVVLNTLNLPPTPPEEMPALVRFQVVKELPFAPEQATLDFAVCGEFDPKLPSSVLVAAVRNEDLEHHTRVAKEAGLTLESVGLRPFANLVAVLGNNADLAARNVLVIEIGPQLTEIDIIRKGVLAFSRSASVALTEFGAGPEGAYKDSRIAGPGVANREPDEWSKQAISAMMVEIVRSFEAYRATDPSLGLDEIVVCGSSGLEAQLAEALAARFATRAELFTPDKALNLPAQRARELRGFTTNIGLSIGHGRRGLDNFDFLHPKKPISKRQLRLKKMPVIAATVILFLGSGVTFHFKFIAPRKAEVAALQDEVDEKKKEQTKILEFKARLDALESWLEAEQYWPEVLLALTETFPPQKEAYATRIDLETLSRGRQSERQSICRLKFRTKALGVVNEIAKRLEDAGFKNVIAGRETSSGTTDVYVKDTGVTFDVPDRATLLAMRDSEPAADEAETPPPSLPAEDAEKPEPGATPIGSGSPAATPPVGASTNAKAASPGAGSASSTLNSKAEPAKSRNGSSTTNAQDAAAKTQTPVDQPKNPGRKTARRGGATNRRTAAQPGGGKGKAP